MRELDVSYVLVIFGGLTGYSSDGKCPPCILSEMEKSTVFFFFPLSECLLRLSDGHSSESQISISFCGWFVLEEALTRADTSKSTTTTPPLGSSESTAKAHPSSSTVSCTRCAITASARSTQRPVSNAVTHMCIHTCSYQLIIGQCQRWSTFEQFH